MKKQSLISLALAVAVATLAIGSAALAENTNTNANTNASTVKPKLDVVCVQNAVTKRENALLTAIETRYNSQKAALEKRKTDLNAAWAVADRHERQTAIRKAWKNYADSLRSVVAKFRTDRNAAWNTFKTDRKACGQYATSDDWASAGSDSSL